MYRRLLLLISIYIALCIIVSPALAKCKEGQSRESNIARLYLEPPLKGKVSNLEFEECGKKITGNFKDNHHPIVYKEASKRPSSEKDTLHDDIKKARALKQTHYVQVPFIENSGQIKSKDVRFYAKTFGGRIFVENTGTLTYSLPSKDKGGVVIKEIFTAKRIDAKGLKPSTTKLNYFIGKKIKEWKTNVPCYESVSLGRISEGIDLTLKAHGNNVEKLFTIFPEGNPSTIRIEVKGTERLKVNNKGELEMATELDPVRFTQPLAYQEINGKRKTVEVAYVIYEENAYGFKVGNYDKKNPLMIDPLLASTFIGGSGYETPAAIAIDTAGDIYVVGHTESSDYPTTAGAYDENQNGNRDIFVSKLDSSLSTLLSSTFIGGSDDDASRSGGSNIAFDGTGNVYLVGFTKSSDYPTTAGAYDESHNGNWDVFVSKFDSSLSTLLSSTFIGGGNLEENGDIAIDATGDLYISGGTESSDYPTTFGAYDSSHNGGPDCFVSKLDSSLSTLLSSTFIGGSSIDGCESIAIDGMGKVYVAGATYSSNCPTTSGAYDNTHNGNYDILLAKFDNDLNTLLSSTFVGGSGAELARAIAVDTGGNVYVVGETSGDSFPTTSGAYDNSPNGSYDIFLSKLDNDLNTLLSSTFIGGNGYEGIHSVAIDGTGNVYIAGHTGSTDYPTTSGAYDETYNGGTDDVVVSKLDSDMSSLLASTFIGGSGPELGGSPKITIDAKGNVFLAGATDSPDFPTTPGGYDENYKGGYDVFISKLDKNLSANNPPNADAGPDLNIFSIDQNSTIIQGEATDPDSDPLAYRWLEGETELSTWQDVGENGEAYLDLSTVPDFSIGVHTLLLEVDDGGLTTSDEMILTVELINIDDIINFFDESVEEGTLEGRGSDWLAKLRLYLMREMLVIAGELIDNGHTQYACFILQRAYMRCDGEHWPLPDFVVGEAVPELAEMIQTMRTSLGCE